MISNWVKIHLHIYFAMRNYFFKTVCISVIWENNLIPIFIYIYYLPWTVQMPSYMHESFIDETKMSWSLLYKWVINYSRLYRYCD